VCLESLAARVRPLILKKDPVHHGYALNALATYLTRHGHTAAASWCSELKQDWKSVDLESGTTGYYLSITQSGTEEPPQEITDVALAGTWFYGDLVHASRTRSTRARHSRSINATRPQQCALPSSRLLLATL